MTRYKGMEHHELLEHIESLVGQHKYEDDKHIEIDEICHDYMRCLGEKKRQ